MEQKYNKLQEEINLKIKELQEKINQHQISFNEHQTWGHIGDLEHIKTELIELVDNFN
jgi:hypothetical protein